MQIIQTAKAWLYVWYLGGAVAMAFLFALATAPEPEIEGAGAFNAMIFFTTLVVALVGGIPVIVIFTVLEKHYEATADAARTQASQNVSLLIRLDRLIDATRGIDGGHVRGDDTPVAVGTNGTAVSGEAGTSAPPAHSIYHADPTEDERKINSRPFPKF